MKNTILTIKKSLFYTKLLVGILILNSCANENSDWLKAKKRNTIIEYTEFLKEYPQSPHKDSASNKIEELSFLEVAKKNTIKDYKEFIKQFPKSNFTDSAKRKIDQKRPEVAFYAENRMSVSLYLIIDPYNSGKLCEPLKEISVLSNKSDSINPWNYFLSGRYFNMNSDKNSCEYGGYQFVKVVSNRIERIIATFKRKGLGENWIGAAPGDGNIFTLNDKGKSILVGQYQYMKINNPMNSYIQTVTATRMVNPNSPWIACLGNKIFTIEKDGKLNQIGWIGWREIATNGTKLVILMTKGMDKDATWAGRYDGKLYQDPS